MEVVARERGDAAQVIDRQRRFGIRLDVRQHAREALLVSLDRARHFFAFAHGPNSTRAGAMPA